MRTPVAPCPDRRVALQRGGWGAGARRALLAVVTLMPFAAEVGGAQGEIRAPLDRESEIRDSRERQARFERRYREVLGRWATDPRPAGAVEDLIELERSSSSGVLVCKELLNLHELALDDPWTMPAVGALHLAAFGRYAQTGGATATLDLAENALLVAEHAFARLEKMEPSLDGDVAAARGLGAVRAAIGNLRGERLQRRISRALERALAWAPGDADLLAVAADIDEKLGDPGRARTRLEGLQAAGRTSDRVRTALALARWRTGQPRDGFLAELERIEATAGTAWNRVLARELVDRARVRAGEPVEALPAVGSGGRLLRIADLREGSLERAEQARRLLEAAATLGPTARAIYDLGPVAEIDALAESAQRAAEAARRRLAAALPRLPRRPASGEFLATYGCEDLLEYLQ